MELPLDPTLVLCDAPVSIDPEKQLGVYVTSLTMAKMQGIDMTLLPSWT